MKNVCCRDVQDINVSNQYTIILNPCFASRFTSYIRYSGTTFNTRGVVGFGINLLKLPILSTFLKMRLLRAIAVQKF